MDPGQRVELIRESLVNLTSGALLTGSLLVSSGLLGPLPPAAAAAASAIGAIAGNWLATSTFDRFNELCAGFAGGPVERPVLWKALGRAYAEALGEIEAELLQTTERDGWSQEHLAAIKRIVQLFRADVERLWEGLSADPRRAASAVALAATARELLDQVTDPEHSPLQQAWRDRVTVYLATLEEGEVQPGLHNRYLVALISQTLPVRLTASFTRILEADQEAFQAFSLFLQTNIRHTIKDLEALHARVDQRLNTLDERLQALVARGSAPPEFFEPLTVLLRDEVGAALDRVSAQLSDLVAQTAATRVDIGLLHDDVIEQTTVILQGIDQLIEREPRMSPPAVQPPPAPALDPRHKLFGRDEALDLALAGLRGGETVLVHGMPGVGKTALATEVAYRLLAEPNNALSVLWVRDLGAVDLAGLCDAIATQLGETHVRDLDLAAKPVETRALLAKHPLALVLDNLALAATALQFRTSACPAGLPVLITSQDRAVQQAADATIELRTLDPRETPDAAVLLFRDRAKLPADEDGSIAGIAQLLGYHPLALVIAASQILVSKVQVKDLAKSLEDADERLRLGEEDPVRADGDRHRSVRVALQVAWDALDEENRHVLARLAICPAATTSLAFLALVCELSEKQCERRVGALVRRSLTTRLMDRMGLHELVRDFGRGILGDQRSRAERALVAAARSYAHRFAGHSPEERTSIVAEVENLAKAAELGALQADWEAVLDLTTALVCQSRALLRQGYWQQAVDVGEAGITAARRQRDLSAQARLASATGDALRYQGHPDAARTVYETALTLFKEVGDRAHEADTLCRLGDLERGMGMYDDARTLYETARSLFVKHGDQWGEANTLFGLGQLERGLDDPVSARDHYAAALPLFEAVGDRLGQAATLRGLGYIELRFGKQVAARDNYTRALNISEALSDPLGVANALLGLGNLEQLSGDLDAARDLYGRAQSIFDTLNNRSGQANVRLKLGHLNHELGNRDAARTCYEDALALFKSLGDRLAQAHTVLAVAELERILNNCDAASAHLMTALALFEELGSWQWAVRTQSMLRDLKPGPYNHDAATACLEAPLGDSWQHAKSLFRQAHFEYNAGNHDAARAFFAAALPLFKAAGDQFGQAITLRSLGNLEERLGDSDAADGHYRAAFTIAGMLDLTEDPEIQNWRDEYTTWKLLRWLETPDWQESAAFLRRYSDDLLTEATEMLLRRLIDEHADDPDLLPHLALLVIARSVGVEAAYRALVRPELAALVSWAATAEAAGVAGDRALVVGSLCLVLPLLDAYLSKHAGELQPDDCEALIGFHEGLIATLTRLELPVATGSIQASAAHVLNVLGNSYADRDLPDRALAAYSRALVFDDSNAKTYRNRAGTATELGAFPLARTDLERAEMLQPDAMALQLRWCEFFLWQGDWKTAQSHARALLARHGLEAEGHFYLAICAAFAGEVVEARRSIEEATRRASAAQRGDELKTLQRLAAAQPDRAGTLEVLAAVLREAPDR